MKKTGDARRVQRVEKEIQAVLGMYLISGFSQPLDVFVTLSRTIMSADLKSGKVYFTALNKADSSEKLAEEVIQETEDILNQQAPEFQLHIAKELKLRFTPKIKFFHDKSVDRVLKVDRILNQIANQKKSPNE